MKYRSLIFFSTILLLSSLNAFAQQDSIASLSRKFNRYKESELQEKIYAHIDRTFYLTGETMWFRLYYVDGSYHRSLDLSKVAYVELLNKDNKSVVQIKVGLKDGAGYGSLFLPASMASGNYIVRAYTNWMKNFSSDLFFQEQVTVVNPFTKLGLTVKQPSAADDVQFFPEGGHLVSGLKSVVGFRAVDVSGQAFNFHGAIIDEQHDTVVRFKPLRNGIGNFRFTPVSGHTYKAIIHDTRKGATAYSLPTVQASGYVLHVADTLDGKIKISINAIITSNAEDAQHCYVLIHTRETAVKAKAIFLQSGKGNFLVDANSLGEGISHITLFNNTLLPVCERLYFRQPATAELNIHTSQETYGARKKVNLDLYLHQGEKKYAGSNLSLAVFKFDSLQHNDPTDIGSYLWLTSELKGVIASPASYLTDRSEEGKIAVDNLMLTHGWSRFRWEDVLKDKPRVMEFVPEFRGHIITGKVKGLDSTSGRKVVAFLSNPDKNIRLYPSKSTVNGNIRFELREFFGPRKLIAQTDTQIDSIYDLELFSPFSKSKPGFAPEVFDFSENLRNQVAQRSLHMQVQNIFHDQKNDRFAIPSIDTTAFYGVADERYWLDDYTRFPTMEEVMREYVAGVRVRKRKGKFHFVTLDNANKKLFKDNPLVLLDGVPVFNIDKIMALDPRKVKKLEVMTRKYFLGPLSFEGVVSYTTYHGDLSDFELDRRSLVVDYEGLQSYREFFSPRYETDQQITSRIPDSRNLVYWNRGLVTDADGKQKCEFFTPDIEGKYRIVVQGLSKDGRPASAVSTFDVVTKKGY